MFRQILGKHFYEGGRDSENFMGGGPRLRPPRNESPVLQSIPHQILKIFAGQGFLEDDGTLTREIMPDLLHLSEKGYTIWADAIESAVAEALDKK